MKLKTKKMKSQILQLMQIFIVNPTTKNRSCWKKKQIAIPQIV